jgi:hypothetical protein
MAKEATAPVNYLAPTDPAAVEANRVYQEALQRLNESLDLRKNRRFDPMMLAAAQGFLAPTQTGAFTESLGRVAGALGQTQEQLIKEQQQEAQQRLNVAGTGLELERLKQRERAIGSFLGEGQPSGAPAGLPAGLPSGPSASPAGAPPAGAPAGGLPGSAAKPAGGLTAAKPPGFEGVQGIQTMPPNPEFMSGQDYISLNRYEKGRSFPDLLSKAQEMDQKRYVARESGVQDMRSGMFYPFPKGEQVERQIYGQTYKIDGRTAALLDMYAGSNDPKYHSIAKRVVEGPPRSAEGKPEEGKPEEGGRLSEEQLAARRAQEEARAKKLGETAAEREAAIKEQTSTARRVYGITARVENALNESKDFFGIFQRPGMMAAVGNLVSQGLQTPGGSINLPGLQQAVTQLLPGVKQADLDNIQLAAADLAEMELLFRRLYLQGSGAVTEGEQRIVQRIGGGVANSPDVLRARMSLLKERSQYDIDLADAWGAWQKKHPGQDFLKFERSDLYKNVQNDYEKRIAALEKRLPAIPTSQRPAAASASKPEALDTARQRLDKLLQGQ